MSAEIAKQSTPALMLAAIGVVYGDIGTSPLYTLQTTFRPVTGRNVVCSVYSGLVPMSPYTTPIAASINAGVDCFATSPLIRSRFPIEPQAR